MINECTGFVKLTPTTSPVTALSDLFTMFDLTTEVTAQLVSLLLFVPFTSVVFLILKGLLLSAMFSLSLSLLRT